MKRIDVVVANPLQFNFIDKNGELVAYQKLDPFTLLSLEQNFTLTIADLEKAFRNSLALTHPDKFINSTDEQKLIASQYSIDINNAYKDLQNPVFRAITMAKLLGVIANDETLNNVKVNPDILMQVMEYQEQLQSASTLEKRKLKKSIKSEITTITTTITTKLTSKNPTILADITQLNYWHKLLE